VKWIHLFLSLSLSLSLSYIRTYVDWEKPYVSFLSIGNNNISLIILRLPWRLLGFAYQGQDIVFRFIIEYSNLRDFGP
jgi:phosphatidylglycerophosphate synthase